MTKIFSAWPLRQVPRDLDTELGLTQRAPVKSNQPFQAATDKFRFTSEQNTPSHTTGHIASMSATPWGMGAATSAAVRSNPFSWVASPWGQTRALRMAWGAITLLRPQLHAMVALLLAGFSSNAGLGSDRVVHPRPSDNGPQIEGVIPAEQDRKPTLETPSQLPDVMRDLKRPGGYQVHELLPKHFSLPGQRFDPWPFDPTPGRAAYVPKAADYFHFSKPSAGVRDARRVDSLLGAKSGNSSISEWLSPVALSELAEARQTSPDTGVIVYPKISGSDFLNGRTDLERYGFLAEANRDDGSLTLHINTATPVKNHMLGALPAVRGELVAEFVLNKLTYDPETIRLYPSELKIRHVAVAELTDIVNAATHQPVTAGAQNHPVVDVLRLHIPALDVLMERGYRLAGMVDEFNDGPGLWLVRD